MKIEYKEFSGTYNDLPDIGAYRIHSQIFCKSVKYSTTGINSYLVESTDRWYLNKKLHREDGPAIEIVRDAKRISGYYLDGIKYQNEIAYYLELCNRGLMTRGQLLLKAL